MVHTTVIVLARNVLTLRQLSDDGSGTVTILEAYRALIAAGFSPEHTVEFHWYVLC